MGQLRAYDTKFSNFFLKLTFSLLGPYVWGYKIHSKTQADSQAARQTAAVPLPSFYFPEAPVAASSAYQFSLSTTSSSGPKQRPVWPVQAQSKPPPFFPVRFALPVLFFLFASRCCQSLQKMNIPTSLPSPINIHSKKPLFVNTNNLQNPTTPENRKPNQKSFKGKK